MSRLVRRTLLLGAAACLVAACGSGGGSAPVQVTIDASGFSSHALTVAPGAEIDFVNRDTAQHQPASSCTELNSGSPLASGQTFKATAGSAATTCTVTDALKPGDAAFQATVTIAAGGGGRSY